MSIPPPPSETAPHWGASEVEAFESSWAEFCQAWEARLAGRSDWAALERSSARLAVGCHSVPLLFRAFVSIDAVWREAVARGAAPSGNASVDSSDGWARMVSQGLCRLRLAGLEPSAPWSARVCEEEERLCAEWLADEHWPTLPLQRSERTWAASTIEALLVAEWTCAERALQNGDVPLAINLLEMIEAVFSALGLPEGAGKAARSVASIVGSSSNPLALERAALPMHGTVSPDASLLRQAWLQMNLTCVPDLVAEGRRLFEEDRTDLASARSDPSELASLSAKLSGFKSRAREAVSAVGTLSSLISAPELPADSPVLDAFWGAVDPEVVAVVKVESIALAQSLLLEARSSEAGSLPSFDLLRYAHGLSSIALTVGLVALHALSSALEDWAQKKNDAGCVVREDELALLAQAAEQIVEVARAAALRSEEFEADLSGAEWLSLNALNNDPGFADSTDPSDLDFLALELGLELGEPPIEPTLPQTFKPKAPPPPAEGPTPAAASSDESSLAWDIVPGFLLEADELMISLESDLARLDRRDPDFQELNRNVHTLKGGARMAGARELGEILHRLEEDTTVRRPSPQKAQLIAGMARECIDQAHRLIRELKVRFDERQRAHDESLARAAGAAKSERLSVESSDISHIESGLAEANRLRSRMQRVTRQGLDELAQMSLVESRLDHISNAIMIEAETRIHFSSRTQEGGFDALELDSFVDLHEHTRRLQEAVSDMVDIMGTTRVKFEAVDALIAALSRTESEASERVKALSRAPLSSLESKLRSLARQTGKELAKPCSLEMQSNKVLLDRRVLDKLSPALEHVVRNAIAHGIEEAARREKIGKPADGMITLSAKADGHHVEITISDDGAGVDLARVRAKGIELGLVDKSADDKRLLELLFDAGFSTAASVNEIAGRGVGLDAVAHIVGSLGGSVEVDSNFGSGAIFKIRIPQERSSVNGILARLGAAQYAIPSALVKGMALVDADALRTALHDGGDLLLPDGTFCQPAWLGDWMGMSFDPAKVSRLILLVKGSSHAFCADDFQYVESLTTQTFDGDFGSADGVLGYSNTGDGAVVVVLNTVALLNSRKARKGANAKRPKSSSVRALGGGDDATLRPLILVVDDSITIRKVTAKHLASAGYRVVGAENGQVALNTVREQRPQVILMDLEMPVMNGFEALATLRSDPATADIPVVMISSRIGERHQDRARELGATDFFGKPYDREKLIELVNRLSLARDSSSK